MTTHNLHIFSPYCIRRKMIGKEKYIATDVIFIYAEKSYSANKLLRIRKFVKNE